MKKLILSGLLSAAAMLATPTADVQFISANSSPALGDTIVSPYTISVNGQNVTALCVDFPDSVYQDEKWTAYVSTDGGDISTTYHPGSAQQYEEEAYIYQQITKPGISSRTQINLQEAAWDIMDPSYWGKDKTYKPTTAALNYVAAAQQNFANDEYSNYQIISSTQISCPRVQEFLIAPAGVAPEPGGFALLGGGLFLVGGVFRKFLRKKAC